jgi:hypothetical protein
MIASGEPTPFSVINCKLDSDLDLIVPAALFEWSARVNHNASSYDYWTVGQKGYLTGIMINSEGNLLKITNNTVVI